MARERVIYGDADETEGDSDETEAGMYKVESDFDFFPTPLFDFFPKGIYKYIYRPLFGFDFFPPLPGGENSTLYIPVVMMKDSNDER